MPFSRVISNFITSFILSILTKQKILDSQCGFRLIHKNLLKELQLDKNDFQLESEMVLRASEKNIKIHFIPISTIYNTEKSHIRHIEVTFKFIFLIINEIKKRLIIKIGMNISIFYMILILNGYKFFPHTMK